MSAAVLGTLLLCFSSTASAGFKVVGPDVPIVGLLGEDLVLNCSLIPPTSAVDMEVVWLIGGDIVHHYRKQQDIIDQQLPDYRGRTSLFREELHKGNVSLKLTSVRLSDENTYRCYIAALTGTDESPADVRIEAKGSTPVISAKSLGNGSAILQCKSTGWFPLPQMEWMDSKQRNLSARPTESHFDTEGFTVKREVIVQESDDNSFICRVLTQGQTKEEKVEVPKLLYAYSRHHWILIVPILPFLTVFFIGYIFSKDINLYKRWVMSKFTWGHDNPLPGENIKTYTKPVLIQRPGPTIITQRARGTDRGAANRKDYKEITFDQLFSPGKDEPKVVVLRGYSGYGKSITTRKIIYDWASGKDYTNMFKLVVLLRCKELDMEGQWRSLLELVSAPQRFKPVMESILKDTPHKVLFIIDGFDELKKKEMVPSLHLPSQPFTRAPPADTIQALLGGRILPESFLLVTTRPTAADRLREMLRQQEQRNIEILGFNEDMVKDYFNRFPFESQINPQQTYNNVHNGHDNSFLRTSCCTPVRCWMICSVQKENSDSQTQELETRTSIYLLFISAVLTNTHMDKTEALKKLATLAKNEIWESKYLFEQEKLKGLNKIPLLQRISARQQVMHSFVHQSIQEFLAALYFITLEEAQMQSEVRTLLDSVKGPFEAKNLHLMPVTRFLFGLSNGKVWSSLMDNFRLCSGSSPTDSTLRGLLEKQISEMIDEFTVTGVRLLFFLHYIFEFHEEDIVKKVMVKWKKIDIDSIPLKREDCLALSYCLEHSSDIERLSLSDCNLTAEKLKLLEPALANLRCQELGLDVEGLSDDEEKPGDVDLLVSALGTERILRRLRVKNSQLSHDSVQKVLSALGKQKSVGSVHLSVKTVSLDTAKRLTEHVCGATVTGIISVQVSGQEEDRVCSLYVEKDLRFTTVGVEHQGSCLSVTADTSRTPQTTWTGFLTSCWEQGVCVETLISSPDLKSQVKEIGVRSSQPPDVLSLINTCPLLQEINWSVDKNEQLHITSLSIRKDMNNMLRLTVGLTPCHSPLAVSLVSLSSPFSPSCLDNWRSFLMKSQQETATTHQTWSGDEKRSDLLPFLLSVSGLREVEFRLGSLTEIWAQHILTLIREQPSLNTVRISAGCQVLHDGRQCWQDGILKQEGITLMRESLKRDNCTITITGILDWYLQRRTFLPNQAVKITMKENSYYIQSC